MMVKPPEEKIKLWEEIQMWIIPDMSTSDLVYIIREDAPKDIVKKYEFYRTRYSISSFRPANRQVKSTKNDAPFN